MQRHKNMVCEICGKENEKKHQDFCRDLGCSGRMVDRPKEICDHIVGFNGTEDVAEIRRVSSSRGMESHDYWKFCPECGEMITQGEDG